MPASIKLLNFKISSAAEIAGAFGADRKLVAIASGIIAFLMFSIWCGFEFDNNYFHFY